MVIKDCRLNTEYCKKYAIPHVCNPITGRCINKDGAKLKKLLKDGEIELIPNLIDPQFDKYIVSKKNKKNNNNNSKKNNNNNSKKQDNDRLKDEILNILVKPSKKLKTFTNGKAFVALKIKTNSKK